MEPEVQGGLPLQQLRAVAGIQCRARLLHLARLHKLIGSLACGNVLGHA
eukprot:CAMPEP_0202337958 /NCGR_PEP_ID=MMETSP1126-20121109/433_1 /ASSEMBLY_ACC=CAM_ASM_000457 /TAXON_ID=3047 /ORGANISM="Dunaliella tertiolecta, Strain CCMP1320" /LENGTH=48 /DNA_ID= /DNA_START= /DNA_END= /DNA_ORIENTATION=